MRHGPSSAGIPQFPRLDSIQLTHVSCGVPEAWLGALNPQVRTPHGGFCSGSLKQAPAGAARFTSGARGQKY